MTSSTVQAFKARTAEAAIRRLVPRQLSFWQDDQRAIANELARCALFSCRDGRKPREHYNSAELFVLGEGIVTYTGEELRGFDEDVFFNLAHRARSVSSATMVVDISNAELCRMIGVRQMQHYYDEVYKSIQRMSASAITVISARLTRALACQRALEAGESPAVLARLADELAAFDEARRLGKPLDGPVSGLGLSLISGLEFTGGTMKAGHAIPTGNLQWRLTLDKNLVMLFAKPYLTVMNLESRNLLSYSGRRLQAYFLSHKEPYAVRASSLGKLLGVELPLHKLIAMLETQLDSLKDVGSIAGYDLSECKDDPRDRLVAVRRTTQTDSAGTQSDSVAGENDSI